MVKFWLIQLDQKHPFSIRYVNFSPQFIKTSIYVVLKICYFQFSNHRDSLFDKTHLISLIVNYLDKEVITQGFR